MHISRTAAWMQLFALRVCRVMAPKAQSATLIVPRATIHYRDEFPLISYREVFVDQSYEPPITLPAHPRILDIGGHLGMATLYFARRFEGATIDVYEANPEASTLLARSFAHETISHIRIHARAVGPSTGIAELFVAAGGRVPTDASLVSRPALDGQTIEVQVEDIRTAVSGFVDLLKIDIEGMEYDCLEALAPTPERIRCLIIEFHDCLRLSDRLARQLTALRTAGYRILDEQKREIAPAWTPAQMSLLIWAVAEAA